MMMMHRIDLVGNIQQFYQYFSPSLSAQRFVQANEYVSFFFFFWSSKNHPLYIIWTFSTFSFQERKNHKKNIIISITNLLFLTKNDCLIWVFFEFQSTLNNIRNIHQKKKYRNKQISDIPKRRYTRKGEKSKREKNTEYVQHIK